MRHRVHVFYSFAFARILCPATAGLQRRSAFAKGFGPIKWRGELRRNSAQDTPSRHSGTAGSFVLWLVQKSFSLFLGSFLRKPEPSECRALYCWMPDRVRHDARAVTPFAVMDYPQTLTLPALKSSSAMSKELMKFERFWLHFFLFTLILSVFAYRV